MKELSASAASTAWRKRRRWRASERIRREAGWAGRIPRLWPHSEFVSRIIVGPLPLAAMTFFILYPALCAPVNGGRAHKYTQLTAVVAGLVYMFAVAYLLPWLLWRVARRGKHTQSDEEFVLALGNRNGSGQANALAIRRALANVYCVAPELIRAADTQFRLSRYSFLAEPHLSEFIGEAISCLGREDLNPEDIATRWLAEGGRECRTVADVVGFLCRLLKSDTRLVPE